MKKNLENLDLNLLKLLQVVVETRNTSQAAERLGVSQTSVSRGMAKLRESFGDQLFVRKAHGVEPSELAEKLARVASNMLDPFTEVLEAYQSFDPVEYQGTIAVVVEHSMLEAFGDGIYKALDSAFPNAIVQLTYWQEGSLQAILERKLDYVIHYRAHPMPQEVFADHLTNIELKLVGRKNHPVLSKSSDWEAIHELPRVRIVADSSNAKYDPFDEAYLTRGYKPYVKLHSHRIPILIEKMVNSDAIMFGSDHITCQHEDLESYPLPNLPPEWRTLSLCGGYLQSKRGLPLTEFLHNTIQDYFNSL